MLYEQELAAYRRRRRKALRLHRRGLTYSEIGKALGVSRQRAFEMVRKALREQSA